MKELAGRIAVVTGGGSGMGRELVRQLVAEACNVSMCDLAAEGMAETVRLCEAADTKRSGGCARAGTGAAASASGPGRALMGFLYSRVGMLYSPV